MIKLHRFDIKGRKMAVREVIIYPDPILRNKNTEVTTFDEDLKKLTDDMFDTMYEFEGIGLAGPQIAVNKRIVVIDIPDDEGNQHKNQLVIINPKITKLEGDIVESQEGCLSVPGYQDTVTRYQRCTVEYQNLQGEHCVFDNVDGLDKFRFKKAYACNKEHPHFNYHYKERMQQFYRDTGVTLRPEAVIKGIR